MVSDLRSHKIARTESAPHVPILGTLITRRLESAHLAGIRSDLNEIMGLITGNTPSKGCGTLQFCLKARDRILIIHSVLSGGIRLLSNPA